LVIIFESEMLDGRSRAL